MRASTKSTLSVWAKAAPVTHYPELEGEFETDVAIIGAGITGFTAALLLQTAGKRVAVIDAGKVSSGVSGLNSGHLTSLLLDIRYKTVLSHFGEATTRKVAQSVQDAIGFIRKNVLEYEIECDFDLLKGYLFAEKPENVEALLSEYQATEKTGLLVGITEHVPLPFDVEIGMTIPDQARFHPLNYVHGLAERFTEAGGEIFEYSRAVKIHNDGPFTVDTPKGWLNAREVILATHTPIGFRPAIQTRLTPMRSYIIGVRTSSEIEDALYWDMADPYHYIRIVHDDEGSLLMIGGEDHRTGERVHTGACYGKLERYARERFENVRVEYRWSAQLYDPADGLPYIGKLSNVYIATGFSGEGLTFGTVAGRLLSDQILGIDNELGAVYSPHRAKPVASASEFLKENMGTMAHFVKDRVSGAQTSDLTEIPFGEGRIVDVAGKKTAVYRDSEGTPHILSPVCRHMGCIVSWNSVENSWDCPCHGGRYDATGKVLNGPPTTDLEVIDIRPL